MCVCVCMCVCVFVCMLFSGKKNLRWMEMYPILFVDQ